jgi:FAD binding domain/Berberine and berberine like
MESAASATAVEQGLRKRFGGDFAGELIGPADAGYEEHRRVWNGSVDRRPALIARCANAGDVIAAVRVAREAELPAAVRGGGHSFPGLSVCDDGIVVDLSRMKSVEVDPEAGIARAEAGVLLGELDAETQAHGMAVPAGIVTHTGLAGLTLGGGIGWLMRKHGLTIDQLLSVKLVTAGGELVTAGEEENPDLFWGVRGGGGNFGVVTEFEFRLNPLGPIVLAGPIIWGLDDSPQLLRFYRDWIAEVPDELTTIVVHRLAPDAEPMPPELRSRPVVMVGCCYAGSVEDGERVVRPLRQFGAPLLDLCQPKPFLALQQMFDPTFPHGRWYYFRSRDVAELSDGVIDVVVEHAERIDTPHTGFPIFHLGGAIRHLSDDDTAYSGRGAGHTININGIAETADGFDSQRQWVRDFSAALEPHQSGVYVNFLMDEGSERVRDAYGGGKYERLRALKRRYDPKNVFRLNQNIPPA